VQSLRRPAELQSYLIRDTLEEMTWQVDFFLDEGGNAPVEKYLTSLPVQHRAKVLALIKMLEQEGPNLPFPYSSQVRGKLRELRTQQGKDKLRILYFGDARRVFVLLHGIVKRSAQLPEEDVRVAEARMELHERRLEGRRK
jgi:hypothetical protein